MFRPSGGDKCRWSCCNGLYDAPPCSGASTGAVAGAGAGGEPYPLSKFTSGQVQKSARFVFRIKSSYNYSQEPKTINGNGEVVTYLQHNSGEPPIQVQWANGHTYWVEPQDLRPLAQGVQFLLSDNCLVMV